MEKEQKNKAGRPTKYKPEYKDQAYKLALLGATDKDVADFFEVTESTIGEWKLKHKDFAAALKSGKKIADGEIAHSLYQRAKGYSHHDQVILMNQKTGVPVTVDTIKHYPPDTIAALFWLKNRAKDLWREKQTIEFDAMNEKQVDAIVNNILKIDTNDKP